MYLFLKNKEFSISHLEVLFLQKITNIVFIYLNTVFILLKNKNIAYVMNVKVILI